MPKSPAKLELLLQLTKLDIEAKNGSLTWREIRQTEKQYQGTFTPYDQEHFRLSTASLLVKGGRFSSAKTLLRGPSLDPNWPQRRKKMQALLNKEVSRYSYANLGWGLIPGGTYLRLGEYKKALLSFSTVAALGTITALAFSGGLVVTGVVAAIFALRFYLVSFTESFATIGRLNQKMREELKRQIHQIHAPEYAAHVKYRF